MRSFLKDRKLWRYITGDITLPQKVANETDKKYVDHLEDWDNKNHQIITWFRNTSIPSIHLQFGRYETTKEVWDLLVARSDLWKTQSKPDQSSKPVVAAAVANEDTLVHPSIGNLETLLRQMISSSSTSTTLPTIPRSPDELSNDQTTTAPFSKDVSFADIALGTNEIENSPVASSSSHPTRLRNPPTYLQDYHCTWDLVDLPMDKALVGCKWVYKIKTHSNGSVEHYKACLVAKGFTQEYGIDYEETFAPIACLTIVRSLLAIVVVRKWKLFQMDVKNAFLNGDLEEKVYMKPPLGLTHPPNKGMVLLLIYVDDMIITGDDVSGIDELKQFLSHRIEMKDLGSLSYFLGLEVTSLDDGYLLSQVKYALDLISKAGFIDSKIVSTPLEPNIKLTSLDGSPLPDPTRYRYKKQAIPSHFSTKVEYKALGDTTSELPSLQWLLDDMGVFQPSSTDLYCDNQSAMQIAHNDVFHERTKHIEVNCHFIQYHVAKGTVHLVFIGFVDQPTDLFTKAHFLGHFRTLLSKLKLVSSSPP
ncbi:hypothetical protein SLEP1_g20797 [Rubroshorea leprosula]|uniref:Reverse transcriptase Ty1/copia-type domain-containing protein n=1 Tax=Rubroshorea leprosula TaxID=152421 RepID=A0AAV5JCL6_9ROSI|nr:hypothetical protein SLEP1_g20797 [Rubroshorea leprosula]